MSEPSAETAKADAVRRMFSGIAHRYDFLNHTLSLSIDRAWRRQAVAVVRRLSRAEGRLCCLDVCSGTGDLSLALAAGLDARVVGTDFCHPMLLRQAAKALGKPISTVESDALNLPFGDGEFDAVTIAFGLRNLADPRAGLLELRRVLKPGGLLVVLEFSKPVVPVFRELFGFYFKSILPRIGAAVSGVQGPYAYLPASVEQFPNQLELKDWFVRAGFASCEYKNLTGGIAALHWGRK